MNRYFSAALYCGLLLSGGKAFSAGTDLLERLTKEEIIGKGSTNPFIGSETTIIPRTRCRSRQSLPVQRPIPCPVKPTKPSR